MDFSWGRAAEVALVGFLGVFVILTILMVGVTLISAVTRRFNGAPPEDKH